MAMGLSLGRRNGVLAHHPIMLGINNHQETSLISNVYRLLILIIQYKAFSLSLSSCAASLGTVAQYKLLCSNRKLWTDAVQAAGADGGGGGKWGGESGGWGLAETDGKDANGLKQKQKNREVCYIRRNLSADEKWIFHHHQIHLPPPSPTKRRHWLSSTGNTASEKELLSQWHEINHFSTWRICKVKR